MTAGDEARFDPPVDPPVDPSIEPSAAAVAGPDIVARGELPSSIAVDETGVYWSNLGGVAGRAGGIRSAHLAGAASTTLALSTHPIALAVDAEFVYWTDIDAGSVNRTPKAGGPTESMADVAGAYAIAVADGIAYFTDLDGGRIMRVGESIAVEVIADGQLAPVDIAVVGDHVVWVNAVDGSVRSAATKGGPVRTVAKLDNVGIGIVADVAHVYFADSATGDVMRVPFAGGDAEVFGADLGQPTSLHLDDHGVYWTTASGNVVRKGKVGGTATVLARNQAAPTRVATLGSIVYWANRADYTIVRLVH